MIEVNTRACVNVSLDLDLKIHFKDNTDVEDIQDFIKQGLDDFFKTYIRDMKTIKGVEDFKIAYLSNDVSIDSVRLSGLGYDADDKADDERMERKLENSQG